MPRNVSRSLPRTVRMVAGAINSRFDDLSARRIAPPGTAGERLANGAASCPFGVRKSGSVNSWAGIALPVVDEDMSFGMLGATGN